MLIDKIVGNVETNLPGKSFQIKLTRESFKNMVGNIYSNQIEAIVRELACNANDSHIAAGNKEPFRIHFPNVLEPFFEIEDYGLGLDDIEMEQVYTVLYNSTKDESNEYTGAFGIGAKVPFVYTDNFLVTTIKNGIERVYSMFISSTGNPSYDLMGETKTDKPNGVKVTFSVEQKDFSSFKNASSCLKWFKTQPTTNIPVQYLEEKNVTSFEFNYKQHNIKCEFGDLSKSGFVMGSVLYPYNLGINVRYYVPIGLFKIPMSREFISNNIENSVVINELKIEANKKFGEIISENIKKCETFVDAVFYLNSYQSKYIDYFSAYSYAKYNNASISSTEIYFRKLDYTCNDYINEISNKYDFENQIVVYPENKRNKLVNRMNLHSKTQYVINDGLSNFNWARAKKTLKDSNRTNTLMYFIENPVMSFFDEIGLSKYFIKASSIKLPEIKRNKSKTIFFLDYYGWVKTDIKENKSIKLLVIKSNYNSNSDISLFKTRIRLIESIYNVSLNIYGCYTNDVKKILKDNPDLQEFDEYFKNLKSQDKEFEKDFQIMEEVNYDYHNEILNIVKKLGLESSILEKEKKFRFLEKNNKFKQKQKLFYQFNTTKNPDDLILKDYPLLKYIDVNSLETKEDCEYIKNIIKQENLCKTN